MGVGLCAYVEAVWVGVSCVFVCGLVWDVCWWGGGRYVHTYVCIRICGIVVVYSRGVAPPRIVLVFRPHKVVSKAI